MDVHIRSKRITSYLRSDARSASCNSNARSSKNPFLSLCTTYTSQHPWHIPENDELAWIICDHDPKWRRPAPHLRAAFDNRLMVHNDSNLRWDIRKRRKPIGLNRLLAWLSATERGKDLNQKYKLSPTSIKCTSNQRIWTIPHRSTYNIQDDAPNCSLNYNKTSGDDVKIPEQQLHRDTTDLELGRVTGQSLANSNVYNDFKVLARVSECFTVLLYQTYIQQHVLKNVKPPQTPDGVAHMATERPEWRKAFKICFATT